MENGKIPSLQQHAGQQSSSTPAQVDAANASPSGCRICMHFLYWGCGATSGTFGMNSEMKLFCGRTREQLYMQMHAFLQGFVFCKVICTLLESNSYIGKKVLKEDVINVKSEDAEGDIAHPASPSSSESSFAPVTFVIPRVGERESSVVTTHFNRDTVTTEATENKANCGSADKCRLNFEERHSRGNEHSEIPRGKTRCRKSLHKRKGIKPKRRETVAGANVFRCEICPETFTSSKERGKHRKKVHHRAAGVCHICGKHIKYRHALVAHIRAHTGIKSFVCEQCGKAFSRVTTLCDHRRRAHCCKECQAELVSGQCSRNPSHSQKKACRGRKKRLGVVDSLNMLKCRECGEVLGDIKSFDAHMKSHRMLRPHHCRVCGKGFFTLDALTHHSKQHQEKKFKCHLCDKTFTYKCNMENHLQTHVEGRPFGCEFCSKTFKTKKVLETHLAMHMEDRQFKCHICGKGLTRLQTLKNHMMKMHPDSEIVGSDEITGT